MWDRVEIALLNPDPGQSKWRPKRDFIRGFQVEKRIELSMNA